MLSFGQFLIRADDMRTHDIALLTDSTCDIPDDRLRQYEIGMVPANVSKGEEIRRDRSDISAAEFYRRLDTYPE